MDKYNVWKINEWTDEPSDLVATFYNMDKAKEYVDMQHEKCCRYAVVENSKIIYQKNLDKQRFF